MAVHFAPVCGDRYSCNTSENSAFSYLGFGQWYEFWYFLESPLYQSWSVLFYWLLIWINWQSALPGDRALVKTAKSHINPSDGQGKDRMPYHAENSQKSWINVRKEDGSYCFLSGPKTQLCLLLFRNNASSSC